MKKVILLLVVALAMVLVVPVGAQGPSTYDSGFQVQNLSTTDAANVIIDYYNMDGSVDTSVSDSIAAGSSTTYFPVAASSGFDGSVVISSDQPVAAITNLLGDNFAFGAAYSGFASGDTSVNLPLMMYDNFGFSTWLNVQNTDDVNVANVTLTYASDGCTETASIQPGAAARFDQTSGACMTAGSVDAATVTSNVPVAVTVVETGAATLFAYNGFLQADAATDIVMPLVQSLNFGYSTGIQIQNNDTVNDTDVTIQYTNAGTGTDCTESGTIPAGLSVTFALGSLAGIGGVPGSTDCSPQQFVGGATVTANSAGAPLVAIVNQLNFQTNDKGAASNSFNPANATSMVMFPLIMEANFGFFTGFNVMSLVDANDVLCTFSNDVYTVSATLNTGEVLNEVQFGSPLPDPYVGAATCAGSAGNLIGVANELGSGAGDNFYAYDGFNN